MQKRLVRRIRVCDVAESPREARKKISPLFFLTVESAPVAFVQSCITINSSPAALCFVALRRFHVTLHVIAVRACAIRARVKVDYYFAG